MKISFRFIKLISKVHVFVYKASRGMIGKNIGVTVILLTTIGRKSGRRRTIPLAAIPDGENFFVVASFGGSPIAPSWLFNVKENPNIEISFGHTRQAKRATIITSSHPRYTQLWEKALSTYQGFGRYQQATARSIDLVTID